MESTERISVVKKVHFCFGCGLAFHRVPMHVYRDVMSESNKYMCFSCGELLPDYWPTMFGQEFPTDDNAWLEFIKRWDNPRMDGHRPLFYEDMKEGHFLSITDVVNRVLSNETLVRKLSWDYSYQHYINRAYAATATTDVETQTLLEDPISQFAEIGPTGNEMYITHIHQDSVEVVTPMLDGRLPDFVVNDPVYLGERGMLTHIAPPEAENTTNLVVGYVTSTTVEFSMDLPSYVTAQIRLNDRRTRPAIIV